MEERMSQNQEPGHGHSPAAWTAVIVMLVGIGAGTLFFYIGNWPLVYASAAVTLLGALAGPILAAMGYGVNGPKYRPKDSH